MSLIHTTRQAQGVQRCSTRTCVCCERQGRGWLFGAIRVESWATDDDGFMSPAVIELHAAPVCAKHKAAAGLFVIPRESGQVKRVVIGR